MVQNLLFQTLNYSGEYIFGTYTKTRDKYPNLIFKSLIEEYEDDDLIFTKCYNYIRGEEETIKSYLYNEIENSIQYLKETIQKYDDGGDITVDEIPSAMDQLTQVLAVAKNQFTHSNWLILKGDLIDFYKWYQENYFKDLIIPTDKEFEDLNFDDLLDEQALHIFYPELETNYIIPQTISIRTFLKLKDKLGELPCTYLSELYRECSLDDDREEYYGLISHTGDFAYRVNYIICNIEYNLRDTGVHSEEIIREELESLENYIITQAYIKYLLNCHFKRYEQLRVYYLQENNIDDILI